MKDPKYFKKVASNLARFHQIEMGINFFLTY